MKNSFLAKILIVLCFIFTANHSTSQTSKNRFKKDKTDFENETPDDKYLPNQYDNKKVSPAYKFDSRSPKSVKSNLRNTSLNSTIFTIQVNVNSTNQNIIGDAGNEPSIAINPNNPNQIVIGWRQFDNIASNFRQAGWSYTSDGGQTWTFPGVIEPGIFRSDPVLDYDNAGNIFYNSLTSDTAGDFLCALFKSTTGGSSWNNSAPMGGGDKQWMTVDRTTGPGSGNIYSSWTEFYSSCLPGFFTRSTDTGNNFEPCTTVDGSPYWGTEAVGLNGELFIVGTDSNHTGLIVSKSMNANITGSSIVWDQVAYVFMDGYLTSGPSVNPAGLLGQAHIDIDRSTGPGQGNVYVLASVESFTGFDHGDVMFAKSIDGGLNWDDPIKINDDSSTLNTQWLGTLSVAPNGRIDAVWLDTREDQISLDSSALYYSFSIDAGNTWSANEKLSDIFDPHVGYPNQQKMGDYFDMISDNAGAHLAWANTLNGEEDVYYSFIIPSSNVGINSVAGELNVSIFPNPTDGKIILKGLTSKTDVEIYNSLGEIILTSSINNSIAEINISSHASGIYFIKIISSHGETIVRKIIKN